MLGAAAMLQPPLSSLGIPDPAASALPELFDAGVDATGAAAVCDDAGAGSVGVGAGCANATGVEVPAAVPDSPDAD